ncbi:MAG: hypothetical protein AAF993_12280 [Pseudomonadota bacterium]
MQTDSPTRADRHRATLKYLVKGIHPGRESSQALRTELEDSLPNAASIVVLAVVEGYSVELEMDDLAPFSTASFEPYVAEHVLPEAVQLRCDVSGHVQIQLLKAHYD